MNTSVIGKQPVLPEKAHCVDPFLWCVKSVFFRSADFRDVKFKLFYTSLFSLSEKLLFFASSVFSDRERHFFSHFLFSRLENLRYFIFSYFLGLRNRFFLHSPVFSDRERHFFSHFVFSRLENLHYFTFSCFLGLRNHFYYIFRISPTEKAAAVDNRRVKNNMHVSYKLAYQLKNCLNDENYY